MRHSAFLAVRKDKVKKVKKKKYKKATEAPRNISLYQRKLLTQLRPILASIARIAGNGARSPRKRLAAIEVLKPFTEYINQSHHKALCLKTLSVLRRRHPKLSWYWHPTSTGTGKETDLAGKNARGATIVAAECSMGIMESKIRKTLIKLSNKIRAKVKYYCVTSPDVERTARNIVRDKQYNIRVRRINIY